MADLIININLNESRKKQGLIIETYEGIISHLKNKKYSGQLRNVNLLSVSHADNLSSEELQNVKKIFNDATNLQISKYQYIFSVARLPSLINLVNFGCLFCKNEWKSPMYEIEKLCLNMKSENLTYIHDFSVLQNKTTLYINYDVNKDENIAKEIVALFYIDISTSEYKAELLFDYGDDIVEAKAKNRYLENEGKYRDYKFEREVALRIKSCHWKSCEKNLFIYGGKDISYDMQVLSREGIHLFTNGRKKINIIDFSNINVSYGIDWFEVKGDVKAGDIDINLGDLVNFRKKKDWTEYNGQILFMPSGLKRLNRNGFERDGNNLRIDKKDIFNALEIINYFDGTVVSDYNELSQYQNIPLTLSHELFNTLRNYQKVGVKWLLSLRKNGFGGCLADDMGLGKTLQIIAYLSDDSQRNSNALIVVPKTLLENWKREFKKFSPQISTYVYHGADRNFIEARNNRVIITTYGTLLKDVNMFYKCKFENLIIDEAQNIKNSKSTAYRVIRLLQANTKIIMTGTPLENNIQEYWELMKITNPTTLSFKTIIAGLEENQIIEKVKRLTNPFLLRRFKKDVLDDLPEKEEQIIYCNFDEPQRQLYNNLLTLIKYELNRKADEYEMKSNSIALSGLIYLQEVCCHPKLLPREYNMNRCMESAKLEQLVLMLTELHSSNHKVVVFSRFTRMLEIINKEITKKHFNVYYIDGNINNRQKVVDEFEKSTDGIFLISLKAGGVGLNLVSADTAIIYDPWWNPAVEKQAEDRIYRIGQKNKVIIYRLIVADTIEEKIQNLQGIKKRLFDKIVEGHEVPHKITMDDIRNLLNN